MVWIKRNLFVVIGGVVAVALLAVAVVFAQAAKQKQSDATQSLQSYTNSVNALLNARPFPNDEAIEKFEEESKVIQQFSRDAEQLFEYKPLERMGGQQFKIHLLKALVQLQADATNSNVTIPDQYQFTFAHLVPMPNLVPYSIEPLQESLADIQNLCKILYESKVHALEDIQRFPAYPREPGRIGLSFDYWPRTNVTSSEAVFKSTPYAFRFRGFTSELTEVLNRFASADRFYVVRKIDVAQAGGVRRPGMAGMGAGMDDGEAGGDGSPAGVTAGATLTLAQRMQLMQIRAQQQQLTLRSGAPPALRTVVDEKPLRITVVLDVVKLIQSKKEAEVGPGAPGGPGMAGSL